MNTSQAAWKNDESHVLAPSSTILAFDIGGTRIKAGVVQGIEVFDMRIEPLGTYESPEHLIARLVHLGQHMRVKSHIHAIGISIKGIVDPELGTILDVKEALVALIGQPLAQQVAQVYHLPVFVENDARMYLLGELLYGAGRQVENLLCLTLGTGVGCGVALKRRVLRGPRGISGILGGHLTIEANGPPCSCGNLGCLEALIGTAALTRAASAAYATQNELVSDGKRVTPQEIFAAAQAGSVSAQAVVQSFARYLGAGIVSLVHAYDPDLVVLGGGIMGSSRQFLPIVQAYVDEHAWSLPRARVRVVSAELGDTAALLGVAAFARGLAVFL